MVNYVRLQMATDVDFTSTLEKARSTSETSVATTNRRKKARCRSGLERRKSATPRAVTRRKKKARSNSEVCRFYLAVASCTGGPPWPPLNKKAHWAERAVLFNSEAATEGRPYGFTRNTDQLHSNRNSRCRLVRSRPSSSGG